LKYIVSINTNFIYCVRLESITQEMVIENKEVLPKVVELKEKKEIKNRICFPDIKPVRLNAQ
jgi:hypothetical protein